MGLHGRRHLLRLHALRRPASPSARLYIVGAALGIVGWIVLVAFTDSGISTMLIFAVLWGISAGIGCQALLPACGPASCSPPRYRASAQGIMFFVVRTATGLLSYFFPTMLAATGLTTVGILLVGLLTVALIIGAVWAPRTQGKSLQQIESERYGAPVSAPGTSSLHRSPRTPR